MGGSELPSSLSCSPKELTDRKLKTDRERHSMRLPVWAWCSRRCGLGGAGRGESSFGGKILIVRVGKLRPECRDCSTIVTIPSDCTCFLQGQAAASVPASRAASPAPAVAPPHLGPLCLEHFPSCCCFWLAALGGFPWLPQPDWQAS